MIAEAVQYHFRTTLKGFDLPPTFNMHIRFLRPVTVGKAELAVEDTKLRSGISATQVTLSQEGKGLIVAYVS